MHEPAFGSEWVLVLTADQGLVPFLKEVLGELIGVGEALDAAVHVACVTQVAQSDQSLLRALSEVVIVVFLELIVSLRTALVDVESAVLVHAAFVAILDVLTLTNSPQDISRAAPLALADDQLLALLEFEGEWQVFAFPVLNDNILALVQVDLVDAKSCIEERLHGLTRKLDAAVVLDLYVLALGLCGLARRGILLIIALGNFLARGREVALVLRVVRVVEPEADVVDVEVVAGRVQRVHQSPLQIFQVCLLAALRPPIFEHSLIIIAGDQELAVQEGDFELLQSNVDARIVALRHAAPEALDLVATVSLDEECPQLLIENAHVDT